MGRMVSEQHGLLHLSNIKTYIVVQEVQILPLRLPHLRLVNTLVIHDNNGP